jgi:hypothetical protein
MGSEADFSTGKWRALPASGKSDARIRTNIEDSGREWGRSRQRSSYSAEVTRAHAAL